MEARKPVTPRDLSSLPPKVAEAVRAKPELLETPVKDLPPELRAEALSPLVGTLGRVQKAITQTPIAKLMQAVGNHKNDREKLMEYFKEAEHLTVKPVTNLNVLVRQPTQEFLADTELRMAQIVSSGPQQHHPMKLELYDQLTANRYISPRVGKALAQLALYNLISHPFEAGTIRYTRITTDVDKPASQDEGCILTFHFPVDEKGEIARGLTRTERVGMKRVAISFFYNEKGEIIDILKQKTPPGARKIEAPFNARIHIVPSQAGVEESGYLYRRFELIPDKRFAGQQPASMAIVREAKRIEADSRNVVVVGVVDSEGVPNPEGLMSDEQFMVFETHDSNGVPFRKAVRKSLGRMPQMIYDVVEKHCVQSSLGNVDFGIHVMSRDAGLPQFEDVGDIISVISAGDVLSVGDVRWSETSLRRTYSQRKAAVAKTIQEIVSAVPGLKLESVEQQAADVRKFVSNNRTAITLITGIRDEIEDMRANRHEEFQATFKDKIACQVLGFNAAQFFQAAAKMIAVQDVLNITFPLKDLDTFLSEWRNISELDRKDVLDSKLITGPILGRLDTMEMVIRAGNAGLLNAIREEGEKTRGVVAEARDVLSGRMDQVAEKDRKLLVQGLGEVNEALTSTSEVNRELFEMMGVEDRDMHAKILAALSKPKGVELALEGGLNLGIFAVKLKRSFSSKELTSGAKAAFGYAKDRFSKGFKTLAKAFTGMRDSIKDLSPEEVQKLDGLIDLYESS